MSPRKASSGKPAEGWGTKEVVKFLKQHDLRPYVSAAKRAKVKGLHLITASLPQPALAEHGEAFVRLCQALGITSLLDQGRLRLSLLHLRPTTSSAPLASLPFDDLPGDARQKRERATGPDLRSTSSSATVDEVPKSPASAETAQPLVRSASFEAVITRSTSANPPRAQIAPTKSNSCPTKLPRSHTAPPRDGSLTPTPTPRPLCWSAPDVAARHSGGRTRRLQEAQYRELREMPLSLAYASLFGTIAVKCVLRRSGSAGPSPRNLYEGSLSYEEKEGRDDDDDDDEDDVSLLLLDAHRPLLYADLLREIERVHGPLVAAAASGEVGVRVRYEDKDGDVVNVHSDDGLCYAYSDWLAQIDVEPTKSWRLLIDFRQPPASATSPL